MWSDSAEDGAEMALGASALLAVRGEVSAALGAYDPPTQAEMEAAIAAVANDVNTIIVRIEEQVAEGPVLVVPAPSAETATVAWVRCYDESGALESGVTIQIKTASVTGAGVSIDSSIQELVSDAEGLASGEIPRGSGIRFVARRGKTGSWVSFQGVDAETLSLPSLLGTP